MFVGMFASLGQTIRDD